MLTNEQRAHDLAIIMTPEIIKMKTKDPSRNTNVVNENKEVAIDIYKEYKDLYESSLNAFNRDFSTE